MEGRSHSRPEHIQSLPEAIQTAAHKVAARLSEQEIDFDDVTMGITVLFSLEDDSDFTAEDFAQLKAHCANSAVDIIYNHETKVIRVTPLLHKLN